MSERSFDAAEVGRRAFEFLESRRLPATPENFEIAYAYAQGFNHKIVRAVGAARYLDQDVLDRIHAEFFADPAAKVVKATNRFLQGTLASLKSLTDNSASATNALQAVLSRTQEAIEEASEISPAIAGTLHECGTIVAEITKVTDGTANQLNRIRSELQESQVRLESAEEAARTDALTGLLNKKAFDEALQRDFDRAQRGKTPLSVIILDIDRFKTINDRFGHAFGDAVIRAVGTAIKDCIRAGDVPARLGGEEFGVVLHGASLAEAAAVAERIRSSIERRGLVRVSTGETIGRLTLSCGVAQMQRIDAPSSLVKTADARLYLAKNGGRNRVVTKGESLDLRGLTPGPAPDLDADVFEGSADIAIAPSLS